MNSPNALNYEIRPCKFAERRLLLSSLYQIVISLKKEYQYIGFGGVAFTDFKLFHKELNIDTMYSIEGGSIPLKRLEFNKPYSCINILYGLSTQELLSLDLTKPSIVWLDYDGVLSMSVFEDIKILFDSLPHGSVYIVSCNRQLRDEEDNTLTNSGLEERFKGLVPYDIEENCCADSKAPSTIKKMLSSYCHKVIEERNRLYKTNLKFVPLYNIKYQENRGARMYTFGGVILENDYDEQSLCRFPDAEDPLDIVIPNFTRKEALYIDQILNDNEKEQEVVAEGIATENDMYNYKKFYKFMPNFYDVRL